MEAPTLRQERREPEPRFQGEIEEANQKGIKGKETTPFLLARVKDLTGGDSLDSNIQLVFNNARVAAQTAVALAKQEG